VALDRKIKHRARLRSHKRNSIPAIAILPFVDMSVEQDQEYFCDGISDEITTALGKLDDVRVVSRTSAFAFKGENRPVSEIGEKLNVDTVLEGSVRKAGSMLRITAQLINVADGYHLWSGRFDRNIGDTCCPEDIFSIQDEITLAVVDKLKLRLIGDDKEKLTTRKTESMDAFNSYLKGRHFWNKRTEDSLLKAIEYFEEAITFDPDYAQAYSGLADCYGMMGDYSYAPPAEGYSKARDMAKRALELDSNSAEAHAILALVKTIHELDRDGAEEEFIKAIDLDPDYSTAHHWYALHLMLWRRFDEAIQEIQLACNLDPLSLVISRNISQVLMYARRYDEAIRALQRTMEMNPEFSSVHFTLGQIYLYQGMYEEAIKEFALELETPHSSTPETDSYPAIAYARLGETGKAREILSGLKQKFEKSYTSPFMIAIIHVALGEIDEAFRWLYKNFEVHDHLITYVEVEPTLDPVRGDPRYVDLLGKLGLVV
jgi:TolB-like protein/Flp pilus assembly protein TadD